MKIKELNLESYFSDKKVEDITFNIFIDRTKVLATHTNLAKPAKKLAKEPVKQILHWHIQKNRKYATPKNLWFGKRELVRKKSVLASPLITSSTGLKTAMLDADMAIAKKSAERKKHLRVVNI